MYWNEGEKVIGELEYMTRQQFVAPKLRIKKGRRVDQEWRQEIKECCLAGCCKQKEAALTGSERAKKLNADAGFDLT